jgi:hypothetical protein
MCGGDPARVNGATWKQSTRTQNALPVEVVALSLSIRAAASDSSRMVGNSETTAKMDKSTG